MFWLIFLLVSVLKLIFLPAYHSTDFEVHRNWLAITHSRPIARWYYEDTSEWTLDYPPFFAYFEFALSHIAKFFDPEMLRVENLNYKSFMTVLFQRLSVIVTDIVFALGVKRCLDGAIKTDRNVWNYVATLMLANVGLLMVDHIHFQYNGFLFGVLLLSISEIYRENYLRSALYFAVLLHLKHIFMYVAPVYTIMLFKYYCVGQNKIIGNTLRLGLVVGLVTVCSFGPFVDHLPQVFQRLFPFKRGLSHAYWAPNFWALYNFADKILSIVMTVEKDKGGSGNTGGLVQTFDHVVLPSISPPVTFLLTFIAILPCIVRIVLKKVKTTEQPIIFIQSIVICGCCSFIFGWHVHEKAILMVIIPLTLLTYLGDYNARFAIFLSIVGHYSLFPLLFPPELTIVKITLFLSYSAFYLYGYKKLVSQDNIFNAVEKLYLYGFLFLSLYENVIHYMIKFDEKLPYLPLMLTSVYCSVGVLAFWLKFYWKFLFSGSQDATTKTSANVAVVKNVKKKKVKNQ